tara:strand:- start:832 stop:3249 length:2418 start_codon:yes stop_codon:yes gene_type:complete
MKKLFFRYFISFLLIFISLIIYLSLVGIETERFNNQIKDKVFKVNRNLDLNLKKIKLTLDPFNLKLSAKTIGATIYYSKKPLDLEFIETHVSLASIIKKKFISSNLQISTKSILVSDLVKFVRAINNRPELFILEKIIKNGHIILDLNLNYDEKGNIKDDFDLKGILKNGKIKFLQNENFENINFLFEIKKDNFLFSEINFTKDKIDFSSESLQVRKDKKILFFKGTVENEKSILNDNFLNFFKINFKNFDFKNSRFNSKNNFSFEIDHKYKFKNLILNSSIIIDQLDYKTDDFISNYFSNINKIITLKEHKLNLNYHKNKLRINGEGNIKLEEKFDKIEYSINKEKNNLNFNSNLIIKNINLKKQEFLKSYFPLINNEIKLKDNKLNINFKDKKLSLIGKGEIKIDTDFDEVSYLISKNKNKINFDVELNLKKTNFKIDNLNYRKKNKANTQLKFKGNFEKNKYINLSNFSLIENDNKFKITNLLLGNDNLIIEVDNVNFNFIDTQNKKNKFFIKRSKKNSYEFNGQSFNAVNLINNLLDENGENENKFFKNNINLNIKLDKVYIDEIYFVRDLNGKIFINNNKLDEANISAIFKNKENISFTSKVDNDGKKTTILNSTWAKPLINRYKFIKGFDEGYLDFYSSKKDKVSDSVLIIDNFKVKEIPVLAKLLALASLQGIADLLTGEGIRFTDFEMKFSNKNNLMTIKELYAIGPSISVLMEGYVQKDEIISLRGTLVPASTINRTIASIPLIGDFLIGKKIGEGVFGVSFKIKGPPKDLKTTVNPIKTLTPRFITRTLEKIKKN